MCIAQGVKNALRVNFKRKYSLEGMENRGMERVVEVCG